MFLSILTLFLARAWALELPPGFSIAPFATGVENARQMAVADSGRVIFVGTLEANKVYAVWDKDGDFKADEVKVLYKDLNHPNGVAFRDGKLYVVEVNKVSVAEGILEAIKKGGPIPPLKVLTDQFPDKEHHGWKHVAFGPDGKLYIPIGAPCNVCLEKDQRFASIGRLDLATLKYETIAHGVRNSVGFDWHPETGQLWFTDNGRDLLGDDRPNCELNKVSQVGEHFGFPFEYDDAIPDPQFGSKKPKGLKTTSPQWKMGPHVAPLGIKFYRGKMFPKSYQNQAFIAEHGSWNRSKKIGYRISVVQIKNGQAAHQDFFIQGWLTNVGGVEKVTGRPVAFAELPDGSMLISDDYAGILHRVSFK